jgi:hypothetical protein
LAGYASRNPKEILPLISAEGRKVLLLEEEVQHARGYYYL